MPNSSKKTTFSGGIKVQIQLVEKPRWNQAARFAVGWLRFRYAGLCQLMASKRDLQGELSMRRTVSSTANA